MSEGPWGDICNRVDTCALTGAGAFVAGIPGAEVLANGPLWCYWYAMRYLERVYPRIEARFHGSQPDNSAVIYGAEKFIVEEVERLYGGGRRPELLFLENSCSMSMIGDDLEGIARSLELPFPIVTMDCGGIVGGFAEGYSKACIKVLQKFVDKKDTPRSNTVNLLGLTEFYLNGTGDIEEICRLVQKAGYEIQAVPGGGSSLEAIRHIPRAAVNIVCNEELGLPVAKFLEKHCGMRYVLAGMPYGVDGTLGWLKKIAALLPAAQLGLVEQEASELRGRLNSWTNENRALWGVLWFDEVIVSAPATVALCMAQAVRSEWADMGRLTVICQNKLNSQTYCDAADNIYTVGIDGDAIEECFKSDRELLLLASSSESSVLWRRGGASFASLNIAYPANDEALWKDEPCVGFKGCKKMLQRLWNGRIRLLLNKQK